MATIAIAKQTAGPATRVVGDTITSTVTVSNNSSFEQVIYNAPTSLAPLAQATPTVEPGQTTSSLNAIFFRNVGAVLSGAIAMEETNSDFVLRRFSAIDDTSGATNVFQIRVYDGTDASGPSLGVFSDVDVSSSAGQTVGPVTSGSVFVEIERTGAGPSTDIGFNLFIMQERTDHVVSINDPVPAAPAGTTRTWTATFPDGSTQSGTGPVVLTDVPLSSGGDIEIEINDTVNATGVYQNEATVSGADVDGGPLSAQGAPITIEEEGNGGGTGLQVRCAPGCGPNVAQQLPVAPPCEPICDGGGNGGGGSDAEQLILCDVDANGEVVGTALAVYVYDESGAPTGAPTFVNPVTGDPYVPQGVLQPCPQATTCAQPLQFCFNTTTTGPVDHPGRMYSITLPINPGFAVDSLQVDAVTHAANIEWGVNDPDGEEFRAELTSFIEGRLPAAAVVTITNPNAGATVCGEAAPMTIDIQCLRLDTSPPDLIELIYNGGRDLIQNPGYNESPEADLNQPCGFHLMRREDNANPGQAGFPAVDCTSVANRGWETNDDGQTFEIWCKNVRDGQNVTPTPRGTPVQEVNSDGNGANNGTTIWQTFQVPPALSGQPFRIKLVHGARDPGETHTIRLSTGDTDFSGPGDLINDVTTPPSVTNSGGPNAWTTLDQTLNLNAGLYTFSFHSTTPVTNARGGLFSDMRAYVDDPGQRATATTDDETCVVTVEETVVTRDCQWWAPSCVNGDIVSWKRISDGQVLTNSAFWGQAPAPECCLPESSSGEGGSATAGNLIYNYEICGVVGGVRQTLNRVVITDQSGGAVAQTILGIDGAPVTPDAGWTIGACPIAVDNPTTTEICVQVDNGPVQRWTAIFTGATSANLQGYRNGLGEFVATLPAGAVLVPCQAEGLVDDVEVFAELGCAANVGYTRLTTRQYDNTGDQIATATIYLNAAGAEVPPPVGFELGPCKPTAQPQFDHDLLCEPSPSDVRVIVVTSYDENGVPSVSAYVFPTLAPYGGNLADLVICESAQPDPNAVEIDQYDTAPVSVCYQQGPLTTPWLTYERVLFNNTAPGTEVSRTRHWFNPLTGADQTAVPAGTLVPCDAGIQVVESEEMGCANGVPWSRRRTGFFDGNGQLVTVVYTFVDSDENEQPVAPAGFTLGDCGASGNGVTATAEPGCANGIPWTRRTTLVVDEETGAVSIQTVRYVDNAGVVQVAAPAGFELGACQECCPITLGEVCTTTGRAFAIYNPTTDTTTFQDTATGADVPPGNVIACPSEDPVDALATIGRLAATANGSVPANKQSVTFVNTGTTNATVLGQTIAPGENVTYTAYLDPVANTFKRIPQIVYTASATATLAISWVD